MAATVSSFNTAFTSPFNAVQPPMRFFQPGQLQQQPNASMPYELTIQQQQRQKAQSWQTYQALQQRLKSRPQDVPLDYSMLDKGIENVKTVFIRTPQTVWRGLKGDPNFNFADTMLVSQVPYYLGGLTLALGPLAGKGYNAAGKMAAAVMLYVFSKAGADFYINRLYQSHFGVDLTMKFRAQDGHVQDILISRDFPRFDLITHDQYRALAEKLKIPNDVPDRNGAVQDRLRFIIASSRALKIIAGNGMAALGAGYLARSDNWDHVSKAVSSVKDIWLGSGGILGKISDSMSTTSGVAKTLLVEKSGWPLLVGATGMLAATAYVLLQKLPPQQYAAYPTRPLNDYDHNHPGNVFQQITQADGNAFLSRFSFWKNGDMPFGRKIAINQAYPEDKA